MEKRTVYILSDSVGETAELAVKAAISQFNGANFHLKRIPYVEDIATITEVVSIAKINHGLIAFTLVVPDMRQHLISLAKKERVPVYDIIGPLVDLMEQEYKVKPKYQPGLVRQLDDDYFKKIEAVEFAVKYDDGRDPRGIIKADIVLVGVSRTSKTPLSQYLAHKRLKVANVPIVPEVDPPEELYKVSPEKCFGLKISPEKLNDIRKERLKALGLNDKAAYANLERIKEELAFFETVVNKIGCEVIDVTNKAVEETANLISNIYNNRLK